MIRIYILIDHITVYLEPDIEIIFPFYDSDTGTFLDVSTGTYSTL
jgi:hypothetical protein